MAEYTNPPIEAPVLSGPTVYLKPVTEADIPTMMHWWNDARIRRWNRTAFPLTSENEKRFLASAEFNTRSEGLPFAIWTTGEHRLIGFAALHGMDWANKNCWFGLVIGDKAWWGRGIAGEVATLLIDYGFGELGFHKISVAIFAPNARSLGAAAHFFDLAGVQREECFIDGGYVDGTVLELFARDWATTRQQSEE
jgi:RimJ/RimL family protein N-acetyltransferase